MGLRINVFAQCQIRLPHLLTGRPHVRLRVRIPRNVATQSNSKWPEGGHFQIERVATFD